MVRRRALGRMVLRLVAALLCIILLALAYLHRRGFPKAVTDALIATADERGFYLELGRMRLDLGRGLVVNDVRLFKKGEVGPAAVECSEIAIGLDPLALGRGIKVMKSLRVKDGRIERDAGLGKLFAGDGESKIDGPWSMRIDLTNCDLYDLICRELACEVTTHSGETWNVTNITATVGSGPLHGPLNGHVTIEPGTRRYNGRVVTRFDPTELVAYLRGADMPATAHLIETFGFKEVAPHIEAEFSGRAGHRSSVLVNAKVRARELTYNGVPALVVNTPVVVDLSHEKRTVTLDSLDVYRKEGRARASLTVDILRRTVRFRGTSTLDAQALAGLITPGGPEYISDYHFSLPIECEASGEINLTNVLLSNVRASATAGTARYRHYAADKCSFKYERNGRLTTVSDFRGQMFGGEVTGSAHFFPAETVTGMLYRAEGKADGIDLRQLATVLRSSSGGGELSEGYTGILWGEVLVSGAVGEGQEETINGRGNVKVRKGNIFRLPLFGGLSGLLANVVPGVDYALRQTDANADFEIKAGTARTDKLNITGDILGVKADGSYVLADSRLDFDVELRFLKEKTIIGKITRVVLLPFTKLFRVRLRGTVSDPQWSSVNF